MGEKFQPRPASELKDRYDTVIIGSGGAGLTAAIQAHELGLSAVVLEKEEGLGGNTNRASSGMNAAETNVQLKHGVIDNVGSFYRETYQDGGRLNDKDLLGYFVHHSALAIDWLADAEHELSGHGSHLSVTGSERWRAARRAMASGPPMSWAHMIRASSPLSW